MNRREFNQQLCGAAFAKMAVAQQQTHDTSGKQHSMGRGRGKSSA